MKLDRTVLRETTFIFGGTFILSVIMQVVFILTGAWDITVLLGNILGLVAAVGNFLLMGITVQIAVTKDEKESKKLVKVSQMGRLFLMLIVALIGYLVPIFNLLAVVVPYLFPRIAIMFRPMFNKK